jgi:hypothetical protein
MPANDFFAFSASVAGGFSEKVAARLTRIQTLGTMRAAWKLTASALFYATVATVS